MVWQVLDRNFKLGNTILPITLLLLQYCPSPQRYASDYQPPNYTLWYLEPHTRLSWLRSLLVILYKVGRGLRSLLVILYKVGWGLCSLLIILYKVGRGFHSLLVILHKVG